MANEAKAARLRAEAAKAIALASELKDDGDVKLQLMQIAQTYGWLAERIEQAEEPTPSADAPRADVAAMKPEDDIEPKA